MKLLLAAAHRGPYETLKPVARAWGDCAWLLDGTAAAAAAAEGVPFSRPPASRSGWDAWLRRARPAALLRGTSELPERRNPEAAAAAAASRRGLPVFALEDFPGNYLGSPRGLAALFVEFDGLKAHHAARGLDPARVLAVGNPRYGAARPRGPGHAGARRSLGLGAGPAVLWAGQPDARACRRSLEALAPALRAAGATLLFRAHPRDESYPRGGYRTLLAGLRAADVSAESDARRVVAAADLVATQFSSLAVEAAAQGVPALFALLPGAGADYLRSRCGLTRLPWCDAGAAFELTRAADAPALLDRALRDGAARRAALRAMAAHFAECRLSARKVIKSIVQSLNAEAP